MNRFEQTAFDTARALARRRGGRPALHPDGILLTGRLHVPRHDTPWGVPWLDTPGAYPVTARWSRAAGLPGPVPDGLGLAVRVQDAGGPGRPLELLLTSSGSGKVARHLPLPRRCATTGPYATLLNYSVGGRHGVVAAFPERRSDRVPAVPGAVAAAVARAPMSFHLGFGTAAGWQPLARFALEGAMTADSRGGVAFDPYRNCLAGFRPVASLSALRVAAYAGSRAGRHARPASP
ncbi:phosphodiesterase [Streptomyces sp. cmx-4-9]|uniref:phosphodiesterase n=1 Tax=Streptomyces sp. cmx-4-9 TaxID=2790941 RepID=UPI003980DA31